MNKLKSNFIYYKILFYYSKILAHTPTATTTITDETNVAMSYNKWKSTISWVMEFVGFCINGLIVPKGGSLDGFSYWMECWVTIRSIIHSPDNIVINQETEKGSRVIGEVWIERISNRRHHHHEHGGNGGSSSKSQNPVAEVHLKVFTFPI